jgi:hypothetical protein
MAQNLVRLTPGKTPFGKSAKPRDRKMTCSRVSSHDRHVRPISPEILFKTYSNMKVDVRQATLPDYPAIDAFIREAYPDLAPYKAYDRWRWQFVDNPFGDYGLGRVPVWLALAGDKVVGQLAIQRCGLTVAGRDYAAGWIVDFIILPAFRGVRLGHRLYEAAAESGLALVTLTMGPATRRIAQRLGSIVLPTLRKWTRPEVPTGCDVSRYFLERTANWPRLTQVAKIINRLGVPALLAFATCTAVCLRKRLYTPGITGVYAFTLVDRFDDSVDSVWASVADRFGGVPRTARHLNWRLADCPRLRYQRFQVTRGNLTVGYLVLRDPEQVELRNGILVDALALGDDLEVWRALVEFTTRRFLAFASIEAAFSSPAAIEALRNFGFVGGKSYRPTIFCAEKAMLAELSKAPAWFLNRGDHDWDQIHLA